MIAFLPLLPYIWQVAALMARDAFSGWLMAMHRNPT
jgi:hypothetical protein